MKLLHRISILLAALLLASCQTSLPDLLELNPTSVKFNSGSQSETINITANKNWSAVSSESWCRVSKSSGEGSEVPQKIQLTCESNSGYEARSCVITVTCGDLKKTINVTQSETTELNLDGQTYSISSAAQSIKIGVSSNKSYDVFIDKNYASWIKQTKAGGLTSSTVILDIAENNTDTARRGSVTISTTDGSKSVSVTIQQSEKLALILSAEKMELSGDACEISVDFRTNLTDYVIDTGSYNWITYLDTKSLSDKTATFAIAENPSFDSARSGEIIFKDKAAGVEEHLVIIQAKRSLFDIGSGEISLTYHEQTFSINVESSMGVEASIPAEYSSWLTTVGTKGAETYLLKFKVSENESSSNRVGRIDLRGNDGTTKSVNVTQMYQGGMMYAITFNGTTFPQITSDEEETPDYHFHVDYGDGCSSRDKDAPEHEFKTPGTHIVTISSSDIYYIRIPLKGVVDINLSAN